MCCRSHMARREKRHVVVARGTCTGPGSSAGATGDAPSWPRATGGFLSATFPDAFTGAWHQIARDVDVVLSPELSLHMSEARFQQRPNQWAHIWPTSLALSRWVLEQAPASLPASSCEIGCGTALVSLTLAHRGVIAVGTDREPRALLLATHNARRNELNGFSTSIFDWTETGGVAGMLLVASDVLYEPLSGERVLAMLGEGGLVTPGGRLLLGAPVRRSERMDTVVTALREMGWQDVEEVRGVAWDGQLDDVAVHVLTRPG